MNKILSACSALTLVILIALVYFVVEYSKCSHHSKLIHQANENLGRRLQKNNQDIALFLRAQKDLEQKYLEPQERYSVEEETDGQMVLQEHPIVHATAENQHLVPHTGVEQHPYIVGEEHDHIFHKHHSLQSVGL
jgi:hypothetical protein